jgi:hypothetical protein
MGTEILLINLGSLVWAITQVLPEIASYQLEKKRSKNEATGAMRKALNRTRIFLRNPDFSNTNELIEISDLWNEASMKVGVINPRLGEILGTKSRFWGDHELFVSIGRDKEVISLNDVVSEIEKLYSKM